MGDHFGCSDRRATVLNRKTSIIDLERKEVSLSIIFNPNIASGLTTTNQQEERAEQLAQSAGCKIPVNIESIGDPP